MKVPIFFRGAGLRSGIGRLRRDRVIVVIGDILTADHDRITSRGVVVRPAEDARAIAGFKDNKAPGGITSSASDGGIGIAGDVSAPAGDAAVIADGAVARAPADAAGEALEGALAASDITVTAADAGTDTGGGVIAPTADAIAKATSSV